MPGVYFGQLLGMADHLSFTLGCAGYRIHKIVPYGPVHECLQYLIRRAQVRARPSSACLRCGCLGRSSPVVHLHGVSTLWHSCGRHPANHWWYAASSCAHACAGEGLWTM